MRLAGKTALITGASSGIGRSIALRFAAEGANVVVNYYNDKDEGEEVVGLCQERQKKAGATGATAILIQADVSKADQVEGMFRDALDYFGRLDVLVNNAGIQAAAPSHEVELESFDRVINVNLRGAFLCSREALRHFLERGDGGVIVNNSSVHEIIPKPQYVSYSISKGGMENLTRTLALEYADQGIRVNAVAPGAIITPINDSWIHDPKKKAEVESHIPIGRAGDPEEIAAVFAFLASDEASYITGQTIYACGGLSLFPDFRETWSSGG